MGYEDNFVDRQKTNYQNIRKPKYKISNSNSKIYNEGIGKSSKSEDNVDFSSILSKSQENADISSNLSKSNKNNPKKKKKKFKCKKNFKFSKFLNKSKPLYEYQIAGYKRGLTDDALKQLDYIIRLMFTCENKKFIKCKVDEVNEFIKKYNLADDLVLNKQEQMNNFFEKNFGQGDFDVHG